MDGRVRRPPKPPRASGGAHGSPSSDALWVSIWVASRMAALPGSSFHRPRPFSPASPTCRSHSGHGSGFDRPLGRLEERQRARSDPWRRRLKRGDQVGPEHDGMVIAGIERKPRRDRSIWRSGCQPFGQERRLPEAGPRRDERQPKLSPAMQAIGQVRPRHRPLRRPGA